MFKMVIKIILDIIYISLSIFGIGFLISYFDLNISPIVTSVIFGITTGLYVHFNFYQYFNRSIRLESNDPEVVELMKAYVVAEKRLNLILNKLDINIETCEKDDYSTTGYKITESIHCNELTKEEYLFLKGEHPNGSK